ncbi:P-II family nitrogen regulator [Chloroflexota bacterium]
MTNSRLCPKFQAVLFIRETSLSWEIEVVAFEEEVATVVSPIVRSARTGDMGDSNIFVMPIEKAICERTGEDGVDVLYFGAI